MLSKLLFHMAFGTNNSLLCLVQLWMITNNHDLCKRMLTNISQGHKLGMCAQQKIQLKPVHTLSQHLRG